MLTAAATTTGRLHSPRADPKMVNTKDVTPSRTVVNLLTKGEADMTVPRLERVDCLWD